MSHLATRRHYLNEFGLLYKVNLETIVKLRQAGFETVEAVEDATEEDLLGTRSESCVGLLMGEYHELFIRLARRQLEEVG